MVTPPDAACLLGPDPRLGETEGRQEGLEAFRRRLERGGVERDVPLVAEPGAQLAGPKGVSPAKRKVKSGPASTGKSTRASSPSMVTRGESTRAR